MSGGGLGGSRKKKKNVLSQHCFPARGLCEKSALPHCISKVMVAPDLCNSQRIFFGEYAAFMCYSPLPGAMDVVMIDLYGICAAPALSRSFRTGQGIFLRERQSKTGAGNRQHGGMTVTVIAKASRPVARFLLKLPISRAQQISGHRDPVFYDLSNCVLMIL